MEGGFSPGPWTPELLAEAITNLDANRAGIELRTVQLWFQENDKGISIGNIRWLAMVLGCDDPEATIQWQIALRSSQSRLKAKRREKLSELPPEISFDQETGSSTVKDGAWDEDGGSNLTRRIERIFSDPEPMHFLVFMWALYTFIGLINFIFEVGSVTYSPVEGIDKQIGFIWAPTWNILPLIILPLFFIFINRLLNYWKNEGRVDLLQTITHHQASLAWLKKVQSFSFSFNSIFFICFFFVFVAQWFGVYLRLYYFGNPNDFQIDRNLIGLIRPDIITIGQSVVTSGLGYMYTAIYICIYLVGMLFMYIVMVDFYSLFNHNEIKESEQIYNVINNIAHTLRNGMFRCSLLGLWIAMCIKLQLVYLSSGSNNILKWLIDDFRQVFGYMKYDVVWIEDVSISDFTTLLMVVLSFTVFFMCLVRLYKTERFMVSNVTEADRPDIHFEDRKIKTNATNVTYIGMLSSIILLSASILLIGQFVGFSILIFISVIISIYGCFNPSMRKSEII